MGKTTKALVLISFIIGILIFNSSRDTLAQFQVYPAFGRLAVSGQSTIIANGFPTTLTLVAGTNVTLITNTATRSVTINSTSGGFGNINFINSDGTASQVLALGETGTDFNLVDDGLGTHTFHLPIASATNTGKLSSTDWSTFNSRQPTVSVTAPIVLTGADISITQATTSTNGYLSSVDWSTFNSKQAAGAYLTSITVDSPLSGAGTPASHLTVDLSSKQNINSNLTSLSGLTFASVSFVKMTGVGTFALDTTVLGTLATQNGTFSGTSSGTNTGDNSPNSLYSGLVTMTYPGAGIALSTGSAWGTSITDNSSNWNTAFGWGNHAGLYTLIANKWQWDGGATNLVASTGRTSLGLGSLAVLSSIDISANTNLAVTAPIVLTGDTVSITQSGSAANGYLSSTDWNTFNNKGSGTVTGSGTTGQLAQWSSASALTGGIVASNVALLNAANVFTNNQSITVNVLPVLTLAASNGTGTAIRYNQTTVGSGQYNWQVGMNMTVADTFEWIPSTSAGGSTFSTPVMTLSSAGLLTVSGFGTHTFSSGGTGTNRILLGNTTSGTGNYAQLQIKAGTSEFDIYTLSQDYSSSGIYVASGAALESQSAGGLSIAATNASAAIRLYAGGTGMDWGINAAGDWTFGASSHIADSSGTPTCSGGTNCGNVVGTDYAMTVTSSGAPSSVDIVVFGHTWTTAPICTATAQYANVSGPLTTATTTTTVTIGHDSWSGAIYNIHCRGY